MKKRYTLSLDEDVLTKLRRRNVNVSGLVNDFLKNLPETDEFNDYAVNLTPFIEEQKLLLSQVDDIELKLRNLERKRKGIKYRIQHLEEVIAKGRQVLEDIEKSKRTAMLFQQMNKIIENSDFKAEVAWEYCSGIVRQLKELGKEVDYEWFKTHVERIKEWV